MAHGTSSRSGDSGVHNGHTRSLDAYASCRLTREEKALAEAAAARTTNEVFSDWVRQAVLEKVERDLGPGVLPRREAQGDVDHG